MCSGASPEFNDALIKATEDELQAAFTGIPDDDRKRVLAAKASARAKAMEIACCFSPDDYVKYKEAFGPVANGDMSTGFVYAGSYCGRNIEVIYQKAESAGFKLSIESAVIACFSSPGSKHALLCSGFYVLHDKGALAMEGCAHGSCETDGPLGVIALVRAFAMRGVCCSLFCDMHNGPVIKAGYEAMVAYFKDVDPAMGAKLEEFSRCLPYVSDFPVPETEAEAFKTTYSSIFDGEMDPTSLSYRSVRVAQQLGVVLKEAWGERYPGEVDCLFALERLGAPYRNIRGKDISEHTEAVDCLWSLNVPADGATYNEEAKRASMDFGTLNGITPEVTLKLRALAGVKADPLTLGIGDGGNEVGMGKVVQLEGVAQLSPGGEFAALSVNGTYRTCDHLILGTVSNWAGTAFEMAAYAITKPSTDYCAAMKGAGLNVTDLEDKMLKAIMADPFKSVDGKYNDYAHSVDGMVFEPHHKEFYDELWKLAGV